MVASRDMVGASDSVLERKIASRLADTNRASLKGLAVNVADGSVTLRGCVPSFYEKQLAIQVCRLISGGSGMIDAAQVAVAN